MVENKALWCGCGSFCCALIITGIVLFAVSFRSLEATEFGIKYNSFTKQIDESKIYDEGTYFVGPSVRFIKFPIEVKAVNFNRDFFIRTADGMRLELVVSLQYKLNKKLDVTLQLLRNWGEESLEDVITKVSKDSVRQTASTYTVDYYVYNRQEVDAKMKTNLVKDLDTLGVNLENFQMTDVRFPTSFQNVILDTQNQQIESLNVLNEQAKAIQEANGRLARAPIDAQALFDQKKSVIISRMAAYDQMDTVYTSFVPLYTQELASKLSSYGNTLWASEYNSLINDKMTDGSWNLKEFVPTPKTFKSLFNI